MSIDKKQITGLILAGGLSQRMMSNNKSLKMIRGKTLIQRVIQRIEPQVNNLIINANNDFEKLSNYGHPIIPDITSSRIGPLGGIYTGLTKCNLDYLACVPCDSPILPSNLVLNLAEGILKNNTDAAFATTFHENKYLYHPVFCLLKKKLLPELKKFLLKKDYKVLNWLSSINSTKVEFDNKRLFTNINSPEDLKNFDKNFIY
tara:strand:- start:554 stop:1162 length:609 start_codon:yes stop_codon:yes gene_type:complete